MPENVPRAAKDPDTFVRELVPLLGCAEVELFFYRQDPAHSRGIYELEIIY